jgi:type I restriction enzyme S subunit
MKLEEGELPKGWEVIVLGKACDKISLNGIKIKQKDYLQKGIFPVVDQGQEIIGGYFNDEKLLVPSEPPYIIFGDHTKVKKFINFKFVAGADGVKVLKPHSIYDPKFFYYLIHTVKIPDKGYARHFQFLEKKEIPLPPLSEQQEIVAKIEELFSQLENGKQQLLTMQTKLKTYRQSLFKSAFEGRLTNKNLKDSELPKGWEVKKLGEICKKVEAVKRKEKDHEEEFFYLDIGGIDNNTNKILNHKVYRWKDAPSRAQQIVFMGDVLFSTVRTYMKNIALVKNKRFHGQIASSGFCVIRANEKIVNSEYIFYYSLSQKFLQPLNELQTGSSYPAVRDKDVFLQLIPLPQIEEQKSIVAILESKLTICDKIEETITTSLKQSEMLRQSILKKAFEGQLILPKMHESLESITKIKN